MKLIKKSLVLALVLVSIPLIPIKADPTVANPVIMGPVTVTNLAFSSTPLVGGTTVTLTGSGFDTMTRPILMPANGTTASTYDLTVTKTSTQYSFKIPNNITPGTYLFQFITDGNYGRTYLANSYSYEEYYFTIGLGSTQRPTLSEVSPNSTTIGSNVTITGTNFASQVSLYFNGQSLAQPLKFNATSTNNGTKIVFTVPDSLNAGTYYITVTQPSGVSNQVYFNVSTAAPFVTSISPTSGPVGTEITITGGNFSGVNTVSLSTSGGVVVISENYLPSSNGGTTIKFLTDQPIANGSYNLTVTNLNGTSNSQAYTVGSGQSSEKHSEGTNVLGSDGTVYRITGNVRQPYTSAGAFLSYKFNTWLGVVTASSGDLNLPISSSFIPPRNGSLINDNGTVYLITGGVRAGFANEAAFKGMGYSYTNVYPGDTSFMISVDPINSANQKHPNGTLINDNGTLYVMQNGYRVGFPSMAILDSWGYWVSEAVPANSYDRQAEISGVMQTRMPNQMSI